MSGPQLSLMPLMMRSTGRSLLSMVALVILIAQAGCQRSENATGQPGAGQSSTSSAEQTETPGSSPDAQPHYGQVGNKTSSYVVTNTAGQPLAENANGQRAGDEALSQRVRVALSTGTTGTTGIYAPDTLLDISVTATNGIVTLRGTVGSADSKKAMGDRARSLEGVKGINNELVVSGTGPGPRPGAPAGRGQIDIVPQDATLAPQ